MTCRTLVLGLGVAALALSASCSFPPFEHSAEYATIPGVHAGQTPDDVIKTLGLPEARENGWWRQSVWFDMEFNVWYYKGKGRVIFYFHDPDLLHRELYVYTSEADDKQLGRSDYSGEPARRYVNK